MVSSGAEPIAGGAGVLAAMQHVDAAAFEQVVFGHDAATGLRSIIAVHSTALGPALGGTRFWPYATEADAVTDVCRLARGMSYKHAAAGLDQGGGKAVIWGDPATDRTDDLVRAYARFVDRLGGRYLTAEDVGTTQADMDLVRTETPHVTGVSPHLGGSGDPSPATAWGVRWAIRAAAEHRWGSPELAGRHVCVSGVGKVGSALVGHLLDDGARVSVADVRPDAVRAVVEAHGRSRVSVVEAAEAHRVVCDVFSPCALGAVLSASTVPELACEVIAGSANNQLATDADGDRIAARGILYVTDYVANAGGVINIAEEQGGYDRDRAWRRVEGIAATVRAILDLADRDALTPTEAADRYAESRMRSASDPGADRPAPDHPAPGHPAPDHPAEPAHHPGRAGP